ncbi:hypothetical protein [Paenibacillus psychroresistens]|uniref:hypothetical protein n=1 Tax=Paenibacillus psychroresistens TaxID=1778678 RepID=UPI00187831AA|nr:hypothetical protein [Paenibacillus psychroresistens]
MKEIIQWSLLILPWLSLFFIGSENLRRFMSVGLFVTVINTLLYQAAYYYKWWREPGLFGWDNVIPVPWIYSAYFIATLWIFRYTYKRFWLYILVNLLLDGGYMFLWYPVQQKLGLASSQTTLAPLPTYALMISVALIIYLFQMWQDNGFKSTHSDYIDHNRFKWLVGERRNAR